MRLTPLDIRKQEFTRALRGFDAEEVLAFLQMLSGQWEDLLDESRRKDDRIRELESKMSHYEKVEEALQDALQTARETSKNALQNAEEKAKLIVDTAESRAEDIKREAEQDRHQIKREASKLSERRTEIVTRLRAFLMSELELLARFEGDEHVGFIKLIPAEEQRRNRGKESKEEGAARPAAPAAESREAAPGLRRTSPPQRADTEDEESVQRSSSDTANDRSPYGPVDLDAAAEYTSNVASGESTHAEAESLDSGGEPSEPVADEPANKDTGEDGVVRGAGWTNRSVISQTSDQTSADAASNAESLSEDAETSNDGADDRQASSDEIQKIRRILKDLD